jgi:hypothetical protein
MKRCNGDPVDIGLEDRYTEQFGDKTSALATSSPKTRLVISDPFHDSPRPATRIERKDNYLQTLAMLSRCRGN